MGPFCEKGFIIDVRLDSKHASVYRYITKRNHSPSTVFILIAWYGIESFNWRIHSPKYFKGKIMGVGDAKGRN